MHCSLVLEQLPNQLVCDSCKKVEQPLHRD
jgi:hypothetical protein